MSYHIGLSFRSKPSLSLGKAVGVWRRARGISDWEIMTALQHIPLEKLRLNRQLLDGAIIDLLTKNDLLHVQSFSKPIIEVSNVLPDCPFPRVHSEDLTIGRMAADYFLQLNLRNFAFFGFLGHSYSDRRQYAFSNRLCANGFKLGSVLDNHLREEMEGGFFLGVVVSWLRKLPKPCGVFCCNDSRTSIVLQACEILKYTVPGEVYVMGVDSEPIYQEIFGNVYSYIQQDLEGIGWEAVGMLDHWLRTGNQPQMVIEVPPKGIVVQPLKSELGLHPVVLKACEWIRQHLAENQPIEALAQHVGLSRRSLERLFQAHLGHGPKAEQHRLRLEQACRLLRTTDLKLNELSARLGFSQPRQLTRLFQLHYQKTPLEYRRSSRG